MICIGGQNMKICKYGLKLEKVDRTPCLVKENEMEYRTNISYFNNSDKIVDLLNALFDMENRAEEYVYMLCFDTQLHMIGIFELSYGTTSGSLISTKSIFQRALLCGASFFCIVHNHPSGDTKPSQDDIKTCNRLLQLGTLMGLSLVDFIIIGKGYLSFRTENICDFLVSEDDEKSKILILWEEFGAIPMAPVTERIEAPWLHFPSGTHREEIWSWFENTYKIIIGDLINYHRVTFIQ